MSFTDRAIDLTFRLYVGPADKDYLTARLAYSGGLFHVFYWCAAQACEKYLKAALLLQKLSAQGYNHDLVRLFREVRQRDPRGSIPDLLDLPETTAMGHELLWHGKASDLYSDYFAKYGSPGNRYAFYGTFVNGPVLHALDLVCCAFRRLIRTTNLTRGDLFAHQSTGLMHHERIADARSWMVDPNLSLERLFVERYDVGQDRTLRDTFCNMNFAFFEAHSEGERSFGGQNLHGSPLHNHLVRLGQINTSPSNLESIEQLRA